MTRPALERLRKAADEVRAGWAPGDWVRVSGPGPAVVGTKRRELQGQPYVVMPELHLEPGCLLELRTSLDVPSALHGVALSGEPLELTINSLYPIGLDVEDRTVFDGDRASAAAGPALIQVLDRIGSPRALTMRVRAPHNQTPQIDADYIPPWVWLHFTTPALRQRFELLDLTWARLFLADALAADGQQAIVDGAAALVPTDAHALTADIAAAVVLALAPLADQVEARTLHLVGHSHIDLAWLWRWQDTVEVVQRDAETVLALMDDFPEMCFTHSQPATYEVLRQRRPDLFDRVRKQIDAGRWEPATAQWVETDATLVSGESMARQLLEGVAYSRQHLGRSPEVVMAPDTFGHSGNLPQLARSAGARIYYSMRCNPGGDKEPWPAHWWEGDDGSRILAISTPEYYGHITAGEAAQSVVRAAAAGQDVALQLYGVCDHGGAPTRQSMEALRRLQDEPLLPRLICSTLAGYADALLAGEPPLPVHGGESPLTFRGCYTSHSDAKSLNRHGEDLLVTADTLAALAGLPHDEEMVSAWRTHLRHQFHDILGGSSIADVYVDQATDAQGVEATGRARIAHAQQILAAPHASGDVAVTNPHAWERTDVVEVDGLFGDGPIELVGSHGHVAPGQRTASGLCFVAQVPGFSTVSYDVRPCADNPQPRVRDVAEGRIDIETVRRRVSVDAASGSVMRWVTDGTAHAVGTGLGVVQVVDEEPVAMSAWVIGATRSQATLLEGGTTTVVEDGPVRTVLETTHTIRASRLTRRTTVYADLDRIDVDVDLDWREPGSPATGCPGLKLAFDTGRQDAQAWYETPYAAATRPSDGTEVPALRWAAVEDDAGRGVAVLNDGRHAHDSAEGVLRLRVVRSPYEPDPMADLGLHQFRCALVPLEDGWRAAAVPRTAADLASPLLASIPDRTPAPASALPRWRIEADPGIVVAGLKPERVGTGQVIRLYDSTGEGGTAQLHDVAAGTVVQRATLVEDELDVVPVTNGSVSLELGRFEVVTLVVRRSELTA